MKIDRTLIDQGYITERKHPTADYFIYNYTAKTQYDRFWNELTLQCRGLILDGAGNVIARPFSKFFNYEEYQEGSFLGKLPAFHRFTALEKMDGSLGILYFLPDGEGRIATRGSFESEQAIEATRIWKEKYTAVPYSAGFTFLFEIIYPENRIVVDYGNTRDLILLAVINNETGEEWSYAEMQAFAGAWGLNLVKQYPITSFDLVTLRQVQEIGKEGFVIQFDTGLRVKMKFEEYVRLHRIITGVSTKTIWEYLRDGQPLNDLLDRVPDEFFEWVKYTSRALIRAFESKKQWAEDTLSNYPDLTKAKECGILNPIATKIAQEKDSGLLFAMWKGKPYDRIIWDLIQPDYSKPFKQDASDVG